MAPSPAAAAAAAESVNEILHHLLPILLAAALSARSLVGRWRLLHSKLLLLHSSLSSAAAGGTGTAGANPLFLSLLPALTVTLRSLLVLSDRCVVPDPPSKLLLQSDLDIAAASLSLHLRDLALLLRSGLHNAIVLADPAASASRADLSLFLRDLFVRLQIGNFDLKQKALDSLLRLLSSDPARLAPIIVADGDLPALLRLLDPSVEPHLRDCALATVSLLATACDASCKAVFEEGGLGPLLRLLDTGSPAVKEKSAAAIASITSHSSHAWGVAAYGGVSVLVSACRSGAGSAAVAALKNISAIADLRSAMAEEGVLPVLIDLLVSGNSNTQRDAAACLAALADSEETRSAIVREGGLQRILQLLREASDPEVIEQTVVALHAVSATDIAAKALSSTLMFCIQVSDLISRGNPGTQLAAARIVSNLSPAEETRKAMSGCMGSLIKMLEAPKPALAQEAAAGALVVLLSVKSNRKELARDDKYMTRLARMLDPRREEVCKVFAVAVVLAVSAGGGGGRKRLAEAGACQHLQKLADAEVPGAKKALVRIAGGRIKSLFSIGWN